MRRPQGLSSSINRDHEHLLPLLPAPAPISISLPIGLLLPCFLPHSSLRECVKLFPARRKGCPEPCNWDRAQRDDSLVMVSDGCDWGWVCSQLGRNADDASCGPRGEKEKLFHYFSRCVTLDWYQRGGEGGRKLEGGGGLIYQSIILMEYSKTMKLFNKSPSADEAQGNLMLTGQKCKVPDIVHKAFRCEYSAGGEQLYAYR